MPSFCQCIEVMVILWKGTKFGECQDVQNSEMPVFRKCPDFRIFCSDASVRKYRQKCILGNLQPFQDFFDNADWHLWELSVGMIKSAILRYAPHTSLSHNMWVRARVFQNYVCVIDSWTWLPLNLMWVTWEFLPLRTFRGHQRHMRFVGYGLVEQGDKLWIIFSCFWERNMNGCDEFPSWQAGCFGVVIFLRIKNVCQVKTNNNTCMIVNKLTDAK